MKFVMKTDRDNVRDMCIEYNFCTKMNCAEYEAMLKYIGGCKFNMNDTDDMKAYKNIVERTAKLIYSHSSDNSLSDISLENIAGMIFSRCTIRWVE